MTFLSNPLPEWKKKSLRDKDLRLWGLNPISHPTFFFLSEYRKAHLVGFLGFVYAPALHVAQMGQRAFRPLAGKPFAVRPLRGLFIGFVGFVVGTCRFLADGL
jgi:hypothetical protein